MPELQSPSVVTLLLDLRRRLVATEWELARAIDVAHTQRSECAVLRARITSYLDRCGARS